jgi:hypothetical protein
MTREEVRSEKHVRIRVDFDPHPILSQWERDLLVLGTIPV